MLKVDENMKRAQMRDAVRTQKFWWRTDIFTVCDENRESIIYYTWNPKLPVGQPGSTPFHGSIDQ